MKVAGMSHLVGVEALVRMEAPLSRPRSCRRVHEASARSMSRENPLHSAAAGAARLTDIGCRGEERTKKSVKNLRCNRFFSAAVGGGVSGSAGEEPCGLSPHKGG